MKYAGCKIPGGGQEGTMGEKAGGKQKRKEGREGRLAERGRKEERRGRRGRRMGVEERGR